MSPFDGFGMFGIMNAIFPVFFLLIAGLIIFTIIKGISQWNYNNQQPRLSVNARIVSKRQNVSHSHHGTGENIHSSTSTSYYITFEVESGDRMEFHVSGHEYGLLAEDDFGKLTFQGTRYHGFERHSNSNLS